MIDIKENYLVFDYCLSVFNYSVVYNTYAIDLVLNVKNGSITIDPPYVGLPAGPTNQPTENCPTLQNNYWLTEPFYMDAVYE